MAERHVVPTIRHEFGESRNADEAQPAWDAGARISLDIAVVRSQDLLSFARRLLDLNVDHGAFSTILTIASPGRDGFDRLGWAPIIFHPLSTAHVVSASRVVALASDCSRQPCRSPWLGRSGRQLWSRFATMSKGHCRRQCGTFGRPEPSSERAQLIKQNSTHEGTQSRAAGVATKVKRTRDDRKPAAIDV